MTVAELREALTNFPADMEVCVFDAECFSDAPDIPDGDVVVVIW